MFMGTLREGKQSDSAPNSRLYPHPQRFDKPISLSLPKGSELLSSAGQPPYDFIVNVFPVDDAVNPHLVVNNFKDHAVIPHAQLPIALEGAPQGFPVALGFGCQAGLDGLGDPLSQVLVDRRNIFGANFGVVGKTVGHPALQEPQTCLWVKARERLKLFSRSSAN